MYSVQSMSTLQGKHVQGASSHGVIMYVLSSGCKELNEGYMYMMQAHNKISNVCINVSA
jgi:hypothetical protein